MGNSSDQFCTSRSGPKGSEEEGLVVLVLQICEKLRDGGGESYVLIAAPPPKIIESILLTLSFYTLRGLCVCVCVHGQGKGRRNTRSPCGCRHNSTRQLQRDNIVPHMLRPCLDGEHNGSQRANAKPFAPDVARRILEQGMHYGVLCRRWRLELEGAMPHVCCN